jgi:hypothetical protein
MTADHEHAAEKHTGKGYIGLRFDELDWQDGRELLGLPEGVQVKILRRYPSSERRIDFLVKFPPGYQEPRHTHEGSGMGLVLEGKQVVDGETYGPGTYAYDIGSIPHGPFDYPEGCILFASFHGGTQGGTMHEFGQQDQ